MPFKVPEFYRRGVRLCLALSFFGLAGRGLLVPPGLPEDFVDEYKRSAAWAGITACIINAPLIGKIVQTSAERTLGTLAGGVLGFITYDYGSHIFTTDTSMDVFLGMSAGVVGLLSCVLAYNLGLDSTPRLFAATFMLVTLGAPTYDSALMVAVLRTSGILAGVAVMQLLSVIILPKSATVEAFRDLQAALRHISALSDVVWASSDLTCRVPVSETLRNTSETAPAATEPGQSQERSVYQNNGLVGMLGEDGLETAARGSTDGLAGGDETPRGLNGPEEHAFTYGPEYQAAIQKAVQEALRQQQAGGTQEALRQQQAGGTQHQQRQQQQQAGPQPPTLLSTPEVSPVRSPSAALLQPPSQQQASRGPGWAAWFFGREQQADVEAGDADLHVPLLTSETDASFSFRQQKLWDRCWTGGSGAPSTPLIARTSTTIDNPIAQMDHLQLPETVVPDHHVLHVGPGGGSPGGYQRSVTWWMEDTKESQQRSQSCEKAVSAVYGSLDKCDENVKLSAGEVYLWHFWGHYFFLPGIPNLGRLYSRQSRHLCGRWGIEADMVSNMTNSLRRLSRLLWSAHLSLDEDLTPDIKAAVQSRYPAGMLPDLVQACTASLKRLAETFPDETASLDELHRMASLLQAMQAASSAHHRRLVTALTKGPQGRGLAVRNMKRSSSLMPTASVLHSLPTVLSRMPHGLITHANSQLTRSPWLSATPHTYRGLDGGLDGAGRQAGEEELLPIYSPSHASSTRVVTLSPLETIIEGRLAASAVQGAQERAPSPALPRAASPSQPSQARFNDLMQQGQQGLPVGARVGDGEVGSAGAGSSARMALFQDIQGAGSQATPGQPASRDIAPGALSIAPPAVSNQGQGQDRQLSPVNGLLIPYHPQSSTIQQVGLGAGSEAFQTGKTDTETPHLNTPGLTTPQLSATSHWGVGKRGSSSGGSAVQENESAVVRQDESAGQLQPFLSRSMASGSRLGAGYSSGGASFITADSIQADWVSQDGSGPVRVSVPASPAASDLESCQALADSPANSRQRSSSTELMITRDVQPRQRAHACDANGHTRVSAAGRARARVESPFALDALRMFATLPDAHAAVHVTADSLQTTSVTFTTNALFDKDNGSLDVESVGNGFVQGDGDGDGELPQSLPISPISSSRSLPTDAVPISLQPNLGRDRNSAAPQQAQPHHHHHHHQQSVRESTAQDRANQPDRSRSDAQLFYNAAYVDGEVQVLAEPTDHKGMRLNSSNLQFSMHNAGVPSVPGGLSMADGMESSYMFDGGRDMYGSEDPGLLLATSAEGYVAQVRWASFEWLLDQIGDELEELYMAADALIKSLPHPL